MPSAISPTSQQTCVCSPNRFWLRWYVSSKTLSVGPFSSPSCAEDKIGSAAFPMCPPISVIQGWIKYVLKAWAPSYYACLKLVSLLRSWLPSPQLKSGACSGLVFVKPVLISAQRVKLMLTWQRVCPKKCSGLQSVLQRVLSCRLSLFKATMLNLNTKQEQLGFLIPTLKDILI